MKQPRTEKQGRARFPGHGLAVVVVVAGDFRARRARTNVLEYSFPPWRGRRHGCVGCRAPEPIHAPERAPRAARNRSAAAPSRPARRRTSLMGGRGVIAPFAPFLCRKNMAHTGTRAHRWIGGVLRSTWRGMYIYFKKFLKKYGAAKNPVFTRLDGAKDPCAPFAPRIWRVPYARAPLRMRMRIGSKKSGANGASRLLLSIPLIYQQKRLRHFRFRKWRRRWREGARRQHFPRADGDRGRAPCFG